LKAKIVSKKKPLQLSPDELAWYIEHLIPKTSIIEKQFDLNINYEVIEKSVQSNSIPGLEHDFGGDIGFKSKVMVDDLILLFSRLSIDDDFEEQVLPTSTFAGIIDADIVGFVHDHFQFTGQYAKTVMRLMQDMSMEMSIDHQDFMDIDDNDLMQVDEDARIDAVTDCSRQDSEGTITDWSQQDSKGNIPDWSRQYSKGNITDCSSLESEGTMTDCRSEQELTIEDQSRSKLNNSVWKDQCNSDYTHSLTDEEWNHVGHCEQPAANVKHIVWDENQFDSDDEYKLCDGKGKFN
jgi:hypothetical protein